MKKAAYYAGRILQVGALAVMPASIWAGEIRHSESQAIVIFAGSAAAFLAGLGLIRLARGA